MSESTIDAVAYRAVAVGTALAVAPDHLPVAPDRARQAKGMVAQRRNLNMEEAFAVLRDHARHHNLRLVDVAGDVISGALTAAVLDGGAE